MIQNSEKHFAKTVLLTAILAVLAPPPALAEDDEVAVQSKPESTLSLGVGSVSGDNQRFGQYSGMEKKGLYELIDFGLVNRDDASGTWNRFDGRNLGLESREFRFEHTRQGNWGAVIDYSETPQYSPYLINTALGGIGGGSLINNTAADPHQTVQMSTDRKMLSLTLDKIMARTFDFQVNVRHEEKDGTRMAGAETAGNMAFLAEPIDYKTNQLEATLSYTGEALQLAGGYYGSVFTNDIPALTITPAPASNYISPAPLAPSNMAHQLYVSGGYSFTPSTRGTLKLSYTMATQDETFIWGTPTGTILNSMTSPEARVDTTLAQLGFTSRPLQKLSLLANIRYENRDDKTPELPYVTASGMNLTNTVFSRRKTNGTVEASYQLPLRLRLTGGVDVDNTERTLPPVRIVSWRTNSDETSYRLELKRSMSETLNGGVAVIHSNRQGSDYLANWKGTTAYTTLLAPIIWADRDRDKVRLSFDWAPIEDLSLQLIAEDGRDSYSGLPLGPKTGKSMFYSLDVSYAYSEKLKSHAWFSRSRTWMDQLSRVVNATTVDANGAAVPNPSTWDAQLGTLGDSIGLGVNGKPLRKLDVGLNVQYANDLSAQDMFVANSTALPALPEISYRSTRLQLYGAYAVQKNTTVRVDLIHERRWTNDWTWAAFVYPQDGTTVTQDMEPRITFVGLTLRLQTQ